jgi:S-adenosylmethionine:tRNA ribosyltransferase-isomerase
MRTDDFDYELPLELIAQTPIEPRDAARLLVLDRASNTFQHRHVRDLPELLRPEDVVIANRSKVLPARLRGRLIGGGKAEVLLLRRLAPGRWQALVRPARRLRRGDVLHVDDALQLRITQVADAGLREITVETPQADADSALLARGSTPLPPYIRGWLVDPERYQTVFAEVEGSAAAPTAGLHFTPELLEALKNSGVAFDTLVLHVGLDTFRPVEEEDPYEHKIHREWYSVPSTVQERIATARANAGRVVAIGTTSMRALESWALTGADEGWTELFIVPGARFRVVDALLTNFHLPRSTLLMLVSAFAGRERILDVYAEAIRQRYRFYSFGDAMLVS